MNDADTTKSCAAECAMCAHEKKCAVARSKKCILCAFCVRSPFFAFLFFIQLFCLSCFSFLLFRYSSIFSVYFAFSFLHFVSFPVRECFTCFVCFILLETLLHRVMGYTGVWRTNTTVQHSRSIPEATKTFKPLRNHENRKNRTQVRDPDTCTLNPSTVVGLATFNS